MSELVKQIENTEVLETAIVESSKTSPKVLVDPFLKPVKLVLDEDVGGKVIVRGEFGRAGVPTENKRVYGGKLWEQQIQKLKKSLKERKVLGMIEHPTNGRTSLKDVSHVVTDLYLNEEGVLIGEAEILPTACGKDLAAILRSGCPVGVSSRGYGSTIRNERGEDVVQEDYQLVTFDFVSDPADSTAYPKVISESKKLIFEGKEIVEMSIGEPDLAQEKKLSKKWADMLENEINPEKMEEKENFKKEMLDKIAEMKSVIYDEVKKELLADPNVAGAKVALEQVQKLLKPYIASESKDESSSNKEIDLLKAALEEKDKVINALKEDINKAGVLIKELGYKTVLEESISGDNDASLIRKAIGDVKKFESIKDLRIAISSVKEELEIRKEKERILAEKREKLLAAERAQEAQLREHNNQLSEAVIKMTEANKELALRLYAEQQLRGNPQSSKIRSLIESTGPQSQDEINSLIETYATPRKDAESRQQTMARVRNLNKGAFNSRPLDEEVGSKANKEIEKNSFTTVEDFKSLAGLGL